MELSDTRHAPLTTASSNYYPWQPYKSKTWKNRIPTREREDYPRVPPGLSSFSSFFPAYSSSSLQMMDEHIVHPDYPHPCPPYFSSCPVIIQSESVDQTSDSVEGGEPRACNHLRELSTGSTHAQPLEI